MGKKRTRSKKTSKGLHSNVAKKHKFDTWSLVDRLIFKADARAAGKRVCETIRNPDKDNKSALYIRVCTQGKARG